MSTRSRLLFAGTLILAALPAIAQKPHTAKPKATLIETAVIDNTGSTNTSGYQISVSPSGEATYTVPRGYVDDRFTLMYGPLPKPLTHKFFADLSSAVPLSKLPARHGMRSTSFGTATYITYKGQRSPDLTLPGNAKAQALHDDVQTIAKSMHAGGPRRPVLRPLTR